MVNVGALCCFSEKRKRLRPFFINPEIKTYNGENYGIMYLLKTFALFSPVKVLLPIMQRAKKSVYIEITIKSEKKPEYLPMDKL